MNNLAISIKKLQEELSQRAEICHGHARYHEKRHEYTDAARCLIAAKNWQGVAQKLGSILRESTHE